MQAYTEAARENEPHALPDVEVFYVPRESANQEAGAAPDPGWYWQVCFPGCLPDSEAYGPFATEADALKDARESAGFCEHGVSDEDECEECPAPELKDGAL